jgi:hypothetical protein
MGLKLSLDIENDTSNSYPDEIEFEIWGDTVDIIIRSDKGGKRTLTVNKSDFSKISKLLD